MGTQGEKRKTYRVAKDPLDGSFLNGAFYQCHLELQHPDLRDQEIRNRRLYDSSHLFEPHDCLSEQFNERIL
jgi:hypothetical protein